MRRAKRKAAVEARTLTALIEEGLRRVLNEPAAPGAAHRSLPRVSTSTGGLMSGIDLSDSAALQDLEDRDRARRLR